MSVSIINNTINKNGKWMGASNQVITIIIMNYIIHNIFAWELQEK